MTAPALSPPASGLPFAMTSAARHAASKPARTARYAGPADHPRITEDMTAAVQALSAALRTTACPVSDPATKANLRPAADTVAATALPRLSAAQALSRRSPAADGMSLAALGARDTVTAARGRL